MSAKGIITIVGLAAFAGLAGLFAIDELFGPPYKKEEKISVHLPKADSKDEIDMESFIDENNKDNEKHDKVENEEEIREVHVQHPTEKEMIEIGAPRFVHDVIETGDQVVEGHQEGDVEDQDDDDIMFDAI